MSDEIAFGAAGSPGQRREGAACRRMTKEGRPSPGGRGLERTAASAVVLAFKGEGLALDVGAAGVLVGATAHAEAQATPLILPLRGHLLPTGEGKGEGAAFTPREVPLAGEVGRAQRCRMSGHAEVLICFRPHRSRRHDPSSFSLRPPPSPARGEGASGADDEDPGHHSRRHGRRGANQPRATEPRSRSGCLQRDAGYPELCGAGAGAVVKGGVGLLAGPKLSLDFAFRLIRMA